MHPAKAAAIEQCISACTRRGVRFDPNTCAIAVQDAFLDAQGNGRVLTAQYSGDLRYVWMNYYHGGINQGLLARYCETLANGAYTITWYEQHEVVFDEAGPTSRLIQRVSYAGRE